MQKLTKTWPLTLDSDPLLDPDPPTPTSPLLSKSVLPNSRVLLRVDHPNDGNTSLPFDKKHAIRKTPRQGTPYNIFVNNREKAWIPFDCRHHSIHAQEKLRTQTANMLFIPLVCLSQINFRFWPDYQIFFHDPDSLRIRSLTSIQGAPASGF